MKLLGSEVIGASRSILKNYGEVFEHSADFVWGHHIVSAQTCLGPEQAGKTVNEDAILAIQCRDGSTIKWACAIADGVSTSVLSAVGSRVATWAALAGLCESTRRHSPKSQALDAVRYAHEGIRSLAKFLDDDHLELQFKPQYLPAPAYRRAVERRSCLQTTLCIVWCDGRSIFIASVGDSGALLSTRTDPCNSLFFPDVSSSQVNAVCSKLESIELDQWQQISASNLTLAVFTDGVAKSLAETYGSQLDDFRLDNFTLANSATELLDTLATSTSEEAADNMSLLVVRAS